MLIIKILGPGCANCRKLAYLAERAKIHLGIEAEIIKVTDPEEMMKYRILTLPGLVINEKLVACGYIPSEAEISRFLLTAQEAV
jgi:small redox-active disulfide protein 2